MIRLITGGQRSGKSNFAEALLKDKKSVAYMATSIAGDEEMKARIKNHQSSRPCEWRTVEKNYGLADEVGEEDFYLLECLGTLTSNILFDYTKDTEYVDDDLMKAIEDRLFDQVKALVDRVREEDKDLIIVTNEVGMCLTSLNHIGRVYTDILGRLNQKVARMADQVYLVVSGIEVRIK